MLLLGAAVAILHLFWGDIGFISLQGYWDMFCEFYLVQQCNSSSDGNYIDFFMDRNWSVLCGLIIINEP